MDKIPSQMDICFSEKCNLDCDYCFVNKTSTDVLDFPTVKAAVDAFFALEGKSKTITFTTSEPFLYPDLFRDSVTYIFGTGEELGIDIRIVATTNGARFDARMREFVVALDPAKFTLNFSLDGNRKSHDAHRKFRGGKKTDSTFDTAIANFAAYPRRDLVRVITTITPSEAGLLSENVDFIMSQGFGNIDLFPQMFAIWGEEERNTLDRELKKVVRNFNDGPWAGRNLRLLNRLWGDTHYAKILLGSDGKFYLFEWVLPLQYEDRHAYEIGSPHDLNVGKRNALFAFLFGKTAAKNGGVCASCEFRPFCADPIPMYMWATHRKMDFDAYFANFCRMSAIMIRNSGTVERKNVLDVEKWGKAAKGNTAG